MSAAEDHAAEDHLVYPHDHPYPLSPKGRRCSGRWYCITCDEWFGSIPCT